MINAIRLTEELERVGFTPEQAKKSVDTWMSLINENFATKSDLREFQLVSKSDLREVQINLQSEIKDLRTDLEGQIKELRNEMNAKFDNLESKLTIKLGLMLAAAVGLMSTLQALSH